MLARRIKDYFPTMVMVAKPLAREIRLVAAASFVLRFTRQDTELRIPHIRSIRCASTSSHTMDTENRTDHLTRTSNNSRDDGTHFVTVKEIRKLSPTIQELVLASDSSPPTFTFKAGQWVDVFIPGVETVGGFSMCSSPQELASKGQLRLAVKYSTHPPALWVHEKCKAGDKLSIRVGGDFFLTIGNAGKTNLLFIAGGVGITPISSMVHYVMEGRYTFAAGIRTALLYSAKSNDELIYKDTFDKYDESDDNFRVKYFLTANSAKDESLNSLSCQRGRLCISDLQSAIQWLSEPGGGMKCRVLVCGPPLMTEEVSDMLRKLKISDIYYEKWW